jgi:hypothetical protein
LSRLNEDNVFTYYLTHHHYWLLIKSPEFMNIYTAVVFGLLLGGAITAIRLPQIQKAIPLIPKAVERKQLIVGALSGIGGVFLTLFIFLLAFIDNPMPGTLFLFFITTSLIVSAVGAVLLTIIIWTIVGGEGKLGTLWAALGGFLSGANWMLFSLSFWLFIH